MNILVLTYIQTSLNKWRETTAKNINTWLKEKDVNVTVIFVRSHMCEEVNIYEEIDLDAEIHVVNFESYKETEKILFCVDQFLEPANHTVFLKKLEEVIIEKEYDIVQIDSILFAPYLESMILMSKAKLVFKPAFVESEELEKIGQIPKFSIIKRYHFGRYISKVRDFERIFARKFDYMVVSDIDMYEYFYKVGLKNFYFIPESCTIEDNWNENIENKIEGGLKIYYAGFLHSKEVMRAILWFLNNVWKSLLKLDHTIEFHIGGKAPEWFVQLLEGRFGVYYHGQVENMDEFIRDKNILLLPFEKSIGVTDVMIKSLKAGKLIIANPIAVRDLHFTPMFHYMPARTAGAYERLIERILKQPNILPDSSKEIIKFAKENLTDDFLPKILLNFYRQIIKQKIESKL